MRRIDMLGDRFDAWFQVRLPLAARRDRIDLFHFPASVAPAWCPVPYVATVHDIIPLRVPGELPPDRTRAYRRGVSRAVRGADRIITISNSTRADLHEEFGVPLDRMSTILWPPDMRIVAAAQAAFTSAQRQQILEKYELADRWLITFSGGGRRKNARGVLDGFSRVSPEHRRGVQVVMIGCEPTAYRQQLVADAERMGIAGSCRVLGYLPDEDIPTLLRGSSGLLIPSRYEGFGWPILDAFVCGVPVLTSNVSSMPEVAGDAAVYCDPHDPRSIATGITRLLDAEAAAELVRKGRSRLAVFDRERHVEAICGVYEQCVTRRRVASSRGSRTSHAAVGAAAEVLER
jgi:alpha-1,3-rhamnosyl/mannosyltransferase